MPPSAVDHHAALPSKGAYKNLRSSETIESTTVCPATRADDSTPCAAPDDDTIISPALKAQLFHELDVPTDDDAASACNDASRCTHASMAAMLDARSPSCAPATVSKVFLTVNFEGNIGAGKSTLIERVGALLSPLYNVMNKSENVGEWVEKNDNFLRKYYEDTTKYAFSFQTNAMFDRMIDDMSLIAVKERSPGVRIVLRERSRMSDRIFARVNTNMGAIAHEEFDVYNKGFTLWEMLLPEPSDVVYVLRTDATKCMANIKQRARPGEETIALTYLMLLEKQHRATDWAGDDTKRVFVVDYDNTKMDIVATQIAYDLISMVINKLMEINTCKQASKGDAALIYLSQCYMNSLRANTSGAKRVVLPVSHVHT